MYLVIAEIDTLTLQRFIYMYIDFKYQAKKKAVVDPNNAFVSNYKKNDVKMTISV